jgi:hypothetical protein
VRKQTPPDRGWQVRVPDGSERTFAANFDAGAGSSEQLAE